MIKQKIITVLCLIAFTVIHSCAQTITPDIISNAGDYYSNSIGSLSWTIGEPNIATYSGGSNMLTQGFQQSSYLLVTALNNISQTQVNLFVYPNPSSSIINISSNENKTMKTELIDMEGKIISNSVIENGHGEMNLYNLADNIYFVSIYDNSGSLIQTFKIQKVK